MNVFIFIGLFFAMLVATIVILLLKKENKPSGKKSNDYMNDPQFNYMSCNKFNPNSPFFKKPFKKKPFKKKSINDEYMIVKRSDYYCSEDKYSSSAISREIFNGMSGADCNAYTPFILPEID